MVDLCALDPTHELRNSPLSEIGAEYRPKLCKTWSKVHSRYRIAGCTFNQLGPAWTVKTEWRATLKAAE
jgi:hypothetical protein